MSWFLAYSSLHICIFDWLKAQDVTLTSKILSKEIGKEAFTRAVAPVLIAVCLVQDVLNFGRSGAGAPVRDSQGQVRAVVVGNPEIR